MRDELNPERDEAILQAHAEGASVVVIARVAGLARQRVHQIIGRAPQR